MSKLILYFVNKQMSHLQRTEQMCWYQCCPLLYGLLTHVEWNVLCLNFILAKYPFNASNYDNIRSLVLRPIQDDHICRWYLYFDRLAICRDSIVSPSWNLLTSVAFFP